MRCWYRGMRPRWRRGEQQPESLTALARSVRDPDAFQEFYATNVERLLGFFMRRLFDPEAALDLTAETFAVALERRSQFRGTADHEASGWLFAIGRSQLSRFYSRLRVEREALARLQITLPELDEQISEQVGQFVDIEALRAEVGAAIASLPMEQAYAVEQRVVLERSYSELASELAVTEQVVRARVSRGLRALAATLDQVAVGERAR